MLLAQGRFWRALSSRGLGGVVLEIQKGALPEDLYELRDLKIEVPLVQWNRVVKNVHSDRKLLGGLLLDFAKPKARVSAVVGTDRLLVELRRVVLDATATLVEGGVLVLTVAEAAEQ